MSLAGYEVVFATVSLLLPGYFINLVLRSQRYRKSEESQISFFRWLVLGTIAELPWLVIGFLVLAPHWSTDQGAWEYIVDNRWPFTGAWIMAVFFWPFVVGWAFGESESVYIEETRSGRLWWLPAKVGKLVFAQGPINDESAWDMKFTYLDNARGQWILVELIDDEWIAGVFGTESHASVDPNERDLYVADVRYTSFGEERFPGLGGPEGMLIPAEQIKLVHFWR